MQLLLGSGSANTPVARKRLSERHMIATKLADAGVGELLEAVFSVRSMLRLYRGASPEPAVSECSWQAASPRGL
jgi:hypothetical protein